MTEEEKLAEKREKRRKRQRAYYEANKSKIIEQHRAYYQANKTEKAAYAHAYYEAHKETMTEQANARRLERVYGLTKEQYDSMLELQGNACAVCSTGTPASKVGWHVDHCHTTGKVRGILCHQCNVGLGNFRDSKASLQSAIDYLTAAERLH